VHQEIPIGLCAFGFEDVPVSKIYLDCGGQEMNIRIKVSYIYTICHDQSTLHRILEQISVNSMISEQGRVPGQSKVAVRKQPECCRA
jgi:hypothetical protein